MEDVGGCEERQARVMVLVVVPAKKVLQPRPGIELTGEASRVVRLVLERLKLRFAESVVVGDVGAAKTA